MFLLSSFVVSDDLLLLTRACTFVLLASFDLVLCLVRQERVWSLVVVVLTVSIERQSKSSVAVVKCM